MRHRVTWLVTSVSPGGCEGCGPANTLSSDWTLSDLSNKSHAQPLSSSFSWPWWCQVRCYNTVTSQSEAWEERQWPIRGQHGFCHHPVSRVTRNNLLWHSLPVTNVTQQTPSPPSLLASRHNQYSWATLIWISVSVFLYWGDWSLLWLMKRTAAPVAAAHADNIHCSTAEQ